jgi:hypothetical protein
MPCETCRFYAPAGPQGGNCHFAPPTCIPVGLIPPALAGQSPRLQTASAWPQVRADNWCGQWSPALADAQRSTVEPWSEARDVE